MATNPAAYAAALMVHYDFDLGGYSIEQLLRTWLQYYQPGWVRLAAIEALYQGRYKAISVDQLLFFWHRRGNPCTHFNGEFERLIGSLPPEAMAVGDAIFPAAPEKPKQSRLPSIASPHSNSAPSSPASPKTSTSTQSGKQSANAASEPTTVPAKPTPPSKIAKPSKPESNPSNSQSPATPETSIESTEVESTSPPTPSASAAILSTETGEVTSTSQSVPPETPTLSPEAVAKTTQTANPGKAINAEKSVAPRAADIASYRDEEEALPAELPAQNKVGLDSESLNQQPIHQFMPSEVSPEFCTKLKAVAQENPLSREKRTTTTPGTPDAADAEQEASGIRQE